jgi:Leucine-rich repeat (LRR) protein
MIGTPAGRLCTASTARGNSKDRLLPVVVGAVLLLAAGPTAAQPAKEQHQQAVANLTKLGAKVVVDQDPDGTPCTWVFCYENSFGPKWKGDEADLKHLKGLNNLRLLRIRWGGLTDKGLQHLQGLTTLKTLDLADTKITDKGLKQLQALTGLESLNLSNTQVTAEGLRQLSLKNLQKLEVFVTPVSEIHLDDLPKLTFLGAGFSGVKSIHAKGVSVLRTLILGNTPVTDAGLADARNLKQLQELVLSGPKFTDAGLASFQGLTTLKRVDLRDASQVTGAGLKHLGGLTELEILFLCNTGVTDAGLVHLRGLKKLIRLELDHTQVTDAGLEHLRELPKLVYVSLYATKVTPQGIQKLKQALPNLEHP